MRARGYLLPRGTHSFTVRTVTWQITSRFFTNSFLTALRFSTPTLSSGRIVDLPLPTSLYSIAMPRIPHRERGSCRSSNQRSRITMFERFSQTVLPSDQETSTPNPCTIKTFGFQARAPLSIRCPYPTCFSPWVPYHLLRRLTFEGHSAGSYCGAKWCCPSQFVRFRTSHLIIW